jgi:hypothetical protein
VLSPLLAAPLVAGAIDVVAEKVANACCIASGFGLCRDPSGNSSHHALCSRRHRDRLPSRQASLLGSRGSAAAELHLFVAAPSSLVLPASLAEKVAKAGGVTGVTVRSWWVASGGRPVKTAGWSA